MCRLRQGCPSREREWAVDLVSSRVNRRFGVVLRKLAMLLPAVIGVGFVFTDFANLWLRAGVAVFIAATTVRMGAFGLLREPGLNQPGQSVSGRQCGQSPEALAWLAPSCGEAPSGGLGYFSACESVSVVPGYSTSSVVFQGRQHRQNRQWIDPQHGRLIQLAADGGWRNSEPPRLKRKP